ncbi:hypothetical protein CEUSTIGMA_g6736.t1 [Chlamydomonas eustigma]|uniref:RAP domain-containing protein n=1 Tax=Chlamydomonas eustigma TaxID=1157962 RepID=A0A250X8A2_9CHLO|nr:hypothetical protein CEUSTIGMA_g6736.t1 [Chlamydomonas eustigma]|eukprot:GAX79295.1 hypothetical protein CEUSTIGMA_g6736.t1 [Chlamydomonas eustigma]
MAGGGDLSATVRQQYGSTSSNIIAAAAAGNRHLDTLCRLAWVLASNRGPSPRRAFTAMLARAVASTLAAAQQQQQLLTARASSISGRKEVARALATCTWALGKMGAHLPEPQAEVLLRISEACMKILGPQELSDVAWGIAKLASSQEWQPGDVWLSSLCSQLSQITPHLAPQHLSHIMWALAKLNCKPRPQVMYGLMQRSAALMPRFDSDSLALMLYGLAGLGYRPPRSWIRSYLARSNELLHSHRKTYEPVYQPDLVRFSSEDSGSGQSKPAAFSRVVVWRASTSKRGNEGYGAKSLARTAWSLAALLGRVSLTGRKQLRQNTSRVRISSGSSSSYSARGGRVGKSSRSLDGALLVSPQWLNRFMRHCLGQLPECDAHDLTLLAVGLAVLGPTLTRGWLRKFQAAINRQPTSLDLQIQANMMWAWRKLRGRANLDSKSRTGRVVIRFRLLNRRTKT